MTDYKDIINGTLSTLVDKAKEFVKSVKDAVFMKKVMGGSGTGGLPADLFGGIPPEKVSGVFSAYDSHPGAGAGCGLPVVMGIARLHGGDVLLDSTPDYGTAVIVTLPRVSLGGLTLRSDAPDYDGADRARFLSGFADVLEAEDLL